MSAQRDPAGIRAGLDCYAYCLANPIARIDPSGFDFRDNVDYALQPLVWVFQAGGGIYRGVTIGDSRKRAILSIGAQGDIEDSGVYVCVLGIYAEWGEVHGWDFGCWLTGEAKGVEGGVGKTTKGGTWGSGGVTIPSGIPGVNIEGGAYY